MFFLGFLKAHQAVPKARSHGWLNTMPFHKTPESRNFSGPEFYGMTQRVFTGPCSEIIRYAKEARLKVNMFFAVFKCKTPELVN